MAANVIKGLKDALRVAKNSSEIADLLARGETYKDASTETRRDWQRIAEKRTVELDTPKTKKSPDKKK